MIGKKIQGEFRTPAVNVILFCSILGTGTQLFLMIIATLYLGYFGFMNPEQRANILNIEIFLHLFHGITWGIYFCSIL